MGYSVLVTAPDLSAPGLDLLRARNCDVTFVSNIGDEAALFGLMRAHAFDAIISRTMAITDAMMAACPSLRTISKHGVGISNIDVTAASRRHIAVFSTPGANTEAVSEYAFGLLIACMRHIARFDRDVRAGNWRRHGDGRQLAGLTLGLVGYGRIAHNVARYAHSFGMRVIAFDPFIGATPDNVEMVVDLDQLLARSDAVSLHCPAARGAPPLLDARRLALLPDGAVLVNTARGELVDETALADALRSGRMAAAGLDTFEHEPLPEDSPLRSLANVIMSPHIAGSTPGALAAMASHAAANILEYLDFSRGEGGSAPSPELISRCANWNEIETAHSATSP
jgi:D-3-phosphoglycerate dehydrogenase